VVFKAGFDDTGSHLVEVHDNGMNGGCHMPLPFFVPMESDVVQALVEHHLLEQLLGTRSVLLGTDGNYQTLVQVGFQV
jgi:hypothetical protein